MSFAASRPPGKAGRLPSRITLPGYVAAGSFSFM